MAELSNDVQKVILGIVIGAVIMFCFWMWGGMQYDRGFFTAKSIYEARK